MTKEQQRIVIAEICGWSRTSSTSGLVEAWQKGAEYTTKLPDYPNDLNAMHEAEKALSEEQWIAYIEILGTVMPDARLRSYVHATAAQRAKAFLETFNKWTPND